jgi:hypothetical protein
MAGKKIKRTKSFLPAIFSPSAKASFSHQQTVQFPRRCRELTSALNRFFVLFVSSWFQSPAY